jgi:hypothetical protein
MELAFSTKNAVADFVSSYKFAAILDERGCWEPVEKANHDFCGYREVVVPQKWGEG